MRNDFGKKKKRKKTKKIILWTIGLLAIPVIAWLLAFGVSHILGVLSKNISSSPFLSFLPSVKNSETKLKGEDEGRVNILLLGMPGPGNPGPELTDTIIILSLKPAENKAAMLSIPRDLYVQAPGTRSYARINSMYTFGEQKSKWAQNKENSSFSTEQPTDGFSYCKQSISDITGLPIHYFLKMDFVGFEKIIDELGGVDIYVEKDINDPYFPDGKYGYKTFKISQGQHHMDGNLALKYARSRKTTSDFDRAKRQQQILTAVKEKALDLSVFDAGKIINIIKIIGDHFKTDLSIEEIERLIKISQDVNKDEIIVRVLDNSASGPLKSTSYNGASVMIPKLGMNNYSQIQQIAKNIFEEGNLASETAKIEIQNGSSTVGLATSTAKTLRDSGLNVIKVTDATGKFQTTQIIDYTADAKPNTIKFLKSKLGGQVTKETPPKGVTADIVVILGENFKESQI